MALILNIETSGPICSVCLAKDGVQVESIESDSPNSHARLLTVFIEDLLKKHQILIKEVDAFAVSGGPGSYTGLRIGVSVAKGLCYALDKPLIAIRTLQALAYGIKQTSGKETVFMPVIDARRNDVYTSLYDKDLQEISKNECVTVDDDLEKKLGSCDEVLIGGNAVSKCKTVFRSEHIHYVEGIDCRAKWMAELSHIRLLNKQFDDLAYFEPFYLKEFNAR